MFITVKCLNGFAQLLTYRIPSDWPTVLVGRIVQVPLKTRIERALVIAVIDREPSVSFHIRQAHLLEPEVPDPLYGSFVARLSAYYVVDPVHIYRRLSDSDGSTIAHGSYGPVTLGSVHDLTAEQEPVLAALRSSLHTPRFHPILVHGVTGSGKTILYLAAIREAYALGKTSIILVPEVSLAVTIAQIIRQLAGDTIRLYEYHSAASASDKKALWAALLSDLPGVIIGVHIPVVLPIARLGLIIVDEEHDAGYQEKRHPHINSRDAALLRAQLYGIPIILGSATPSIASLHAVATKQWEYYQLKKRFSGNFPVIRHVFIRPTRRGGGHGRAAPGQEDFFWISAELRAAIATALDRREQVIIFLNRRGMHRFVQCTSCAQALMCNACSVSLAVHGASTLVCHYCGALSALPQSCPHCGVSAALFTKKGVGTQRIVAIIETLFPHARVARADADTTKARKAWQTTIAGVMAGEIDIIVGTQTITKGYHFPRVTVVGIIWADSNLMVPFYTAAERSLQQILQVAGRAGRVAPHSQVIVQSCIKHGIFRFLDETRYTEFYEYELAQRAETAYPPHVRLSEIELSNADEKTLIRDAEIAAACVRWYIAGQGCAITLLGPALPPLHKVQHMFFRKLYLKGGDFGQHIAICHLVYRRLAELQATSSCWFTPNPMQ